MWIFRARLAQILVAFYSLSLVAVFTSADEESYRFTFSPAEELEYRLKLTVTKEKVIGGAGTQQDQSVSVARLLISKTDVGWDVVTEPQTTEITRNGEEINNPIIRLLSGARITYKLDPSGRILDVEGYDSFISGIEKLIPAEVFEQLKPVLNIELLKSKEIADWNTRIGDYIGRVVKVGDRSVVNTPYQLPDGSIISSDVVTEIVGVEACGESTCLRINQSFNSQVNQGERSDEPVVDEIDPPEDEEFSPSNDSASISGSVMRLIDPSTMLIYKETTSQTMMLQINLPELGVVPVILTEASTYEFEY